MANDEYVLRPRDSEELTRLEKEARQRDWILPQLADVVELLPILRVGRPGSPLWRWLEATNANHANLVDAGLLTAGELKAYYREWEERSNPGSSGRYSRMATPNETTGHRS